MPPEARSDHYVELDGSTLTYEQFRQVCLEPNRPAVIRRACAVENGLSLPALQHALDPAELVKTFGPHHQVPVYVVPSIHCAETAESPLAEREAAVEEASESDRKRDMACEDYALGDVLAAWCTQWQSGGAAKDVWYLKDWHFQRDLEEARAASASSSEGGLYHVPRFLGPDWMDPFCAAVHARASGTAPRRGFGNGQSDYRFVYMGVPNTWTGLHHDVFGTYSWSLNVCGDKLWFFPTQRGNTFLHVHLANGFPAPPDIRVLSGFELDAFVQHPGDLVFVPSLFFHQVHNLSGSEFAVPRARGATVDGASSSPSTLALTVSVNHNWCNHFCIERMMRLLMKNARALAAMVSAEDLETVFEAVGHAACVAQLDEMLHSGSNWCLAAGVSFLTFCRDQLEQPGTTAPASLFCFDDAERAGALALTTRLLEELDACKASLYPELAR